jgi:hypothetical protein
MFAYVSPWVHEFYLNKILKSWRMEVTLINHRIHQEFPRMSIFSCVHECHKSRKYPTQLCDQMNKDCLWLRDCCLTPSGQLFKYIITRTRYFSMTWWWWCSQHALLGLHSVRSLKQHSAHKHVVQSDTLSCSRASKSLL